MEDALLPLAKTQIRRDGGPAELESWLQRLQLHFGEQTAAVVVVCREGFKPSMVCVARVLNVALQRAPNKHQCENNLLSMYLIDHIAAGEQPLDLAKPSCGLRF